MCHGTELHIINPSNKPKYLKQSTLSDDDDILVILSMAQKFCVKLYTRKIGLVMLLILKV